MFGSKKKESKTTTTSSTTASKNALNALVKGTKMEGDVHAESDFRVDGEIVGNLTCDGKVIIGTTGTVTGEIKCENAMIEGKFKGTLLVKDMLNVRETAVLEGDIATDKLTVQSGAIFNVTCKMGSGASSSGQGHPSQATKHAKA